MYCNNCGKQIDDRAAVCVHCGVATDNKSVTGNSEYKPIIGFILSFFIPLAGLIVSIIEYKKAKETGGQATFAFAGIIISVVMLVLNMLFSIIFASYFLSLFEEIYAVGLIR